MKLIQRAAARLRRAQAYNAVVAQRLIHLLHGKSWPARTLNLALWVAFHSCRISWRGVLGARMALRGRRSAPPSPGRSAGSEPWHFPLSQGLALAGGQVLIVAELSIPQCTRYRVRQKVKELELCGHTGTVVSWTDQCAARNALQTSSLVLFYRTPALPEVAALAGEARRLGIPVLFDIDDLVFDVEEYAKNSNLNQLPADERANLLKGAQLYCDMLRLADRAVASTPVLAERMASFIPGKVHVLENGLDDSLLALAAEPHLALDSDTVVIGYGSGTRTHDADFVEVENGLLRILDNYPQTVLAIFGYLELPPSFEPYGPRIRRVPFLEVEDYYRALRGFHINLAPLEGGVFNDAKSNIKFIEAAALGIPTIASPRAAFRQIIRDGENGFLAATPDDWYRCMAALVENAGLRQEIGQAARRDALARYALPVLARQQMAPILAPTMTKPPRRRRIMVVNVLFAPFSFGGATVVAEQLALGLGSMPDTEVTVVTGCFSPELAPGDVRRYEWQGLSVFALALPGGADRQLEYCNPFMGERFAELLDAVQPDLVHFHSIQILSASLAEQCHACGVPYVITLHDAWWLCERQFMVREQGYCGQKAIDPLVCADCVPDPAFSFHRRFSLQSVLLDAALLLTPSDFHRQLHVGSGIPAEHIKVNKNGVIPPREGYAKVKGKKPVFAYMGGRAEHKGYFWLKEVLEGLDSGGYTLRLVDIQSKFGNSQMPLDSWKIKGEVEIVPPFEPHELDGFYADVDVLLFPSQWKESFGLTVREAMLRDVWVVATDCGGPVEDLVDGQNGDMVAMDDMAGYRRAIARLLAEPAFLASYRNPLAGQVRAFSEQAQELSGFIDGVLADRIRPEPASAIVEVDPTPQGVPNKQ